MSHTAGYADVRDGGGSSGKIAKVISEAERDPRLPAVYDAENTWGADDDFFYGVAVRRSRSRILDLGCGTGRLATKLVAAGGDVVGVDPNGTSLRAGRAKPGGSLVHWIEGTVSCLRAHVVDAAVMTSHVAQTFVTDPSWLSVLTELHRVIAPGGVLAFDSREPRRRAWEAWTKENTYGVFALTKGLSVETWVELVGHDDGVVTYEWVNVFGDGSEVRGTSSLRFRSCDELTASVRGAGFEIESLAGGWHGEPVGPAGPEIVIVAHRVGS